MEPEHVIDEHATIKGADIEKVYDKCEKWLIEIGANVEKSDKQISIQAIHRKPMDFRWGWIRGSYSSIQRQPSLRVLDMKKIINIEFEKEKDDVILHIFIDPWSIISGLDRFEKRKSYWLKFVGDLLQYLGIELEKHQLQYYYKRDFFINKLKGQQRQLFLSFTPAVVFLALVLIPQDFFSMLFFTGLVIYSFLVIPYEWDNLKKINNKYRELYPDT